MAAVRTEAKRFLVPFLKNLMKSHRQYSLYRNGEKKSENTTWSELINLKDRDVKLVAPALETMFRDARPVPLTQHNARHANAQWWSITCGGQASTIV